jgi:hypothetical protein
MPRYEVVSHVAVELDSEIPEAAAAAFRRKFVDDGGIALRGLAVWPSHAGATPTPLPAPLQQQLVDFFAAVVRHAAVEEDVFRARVKDILGPRLDMARSDARDEEMDTTR